MKKAGKIISILCILVSIVLPLHAQVLNDAEVINAKHWLYDYFNKLEIDMGMPLFTDNMPMSLAEARFNLKKIDKESLSAAGRSLYDAIENFLNKKEYLITDGAFFADTELRVNAEGYFKSNSSIPWDFDYNYAGPILDIPLKFGFSDFIALKTSVTLEKNWFASQKPDNFTNIPLSFDDFRFQFPDEAYGSFVKIFDNWGLSFQMGKQGRQIGYTETGSLTYNNTFETDMFSSLSLFSPNFKYTLDVSQVSYDQFLYMHQLQGILFGKLKLNYLQAAMINDSFSLRQINPMMVMHSFMGNFENTEPWEAQYYNESDVCAYLSLGFDYYPVKNLRIYGTYVQTEIQAPTEQFGAFMALPNGLGGQLGVTYQIASGDDSLYKFNIESVYTTPYLYIKQTPRTSLVRLRYYNETPGTNPFEPVATWIGTPYGPDCFAVYGSFAYEVTRKWSVKAGYLFKIHGDNYADMLFDRGEDHVNYQWIPVNDGSESNGDPINERQVKVYNYYPFAKYKLAQTDEERQAALDEALDLWMSGIPEYENQLSISGTYTLNDNWSFSGMVAYDVIFNCGNVQDNFQSGVEAIISCSYKF